MLLSTLCFQARRTVPQRLEANSSLGDSTTSVPLDDGSCYVTYLLDWSMATFITAPFRQGAPHVSSGKKPTQGFVIEGATKRCLWFSGVHNLAPENVGKTIARSCSPTSLYGFPFLRDLGTRAALHCIALHCPARSALSKPWPL